MKFMAEALQGRSLRHVIARNVIARNVMARNVIAADAELNIHEGIARKGEAAKFEKKIMRALVIT